MIHCIVWLYCSFETELFIWFWFLKRNREWKIIYTQGHSPHQFCWAWTELRFFTRGPAWAWPLADDVCQEAAWRGPTERTTEPSASAPGSWALPFLLWGALEGLIPEWVRGPSGGTKIRGQIPGHTGSYKRKAFCFSSTRRPLVGEFSVKQQRLLNARRKGFITWG